MFNRRRPFLLVICLMVCFCATMLYSFHGVNYRLESKLKPACYANMDRLSGLHRFKPGPTNFTILLPSIFPEISCREKDVFLAVIVNSGASEKKSKELRTAIRKTWGNPNVTSENYITRKWRLFFVLGRSSNQHLNEDNHVEALEFNDIIIGDFNDTYKNIHIKTFMGHLWAYKTFACQYILKTDDDVYVRIPRLTHWLTKAKPTKFYGGLINKRFPTLRDPNSKWYISKEEYNETFYPPYCPGGFHVISCDILLNILKYTQYRRPFFIDDVYIGLAARDLGVKPYWIPGFWFKTPSNDAEFMVSTAVGHNLNAKSIQRYHNMFTALSYYT